MGNMSEVTVFTLSGFGDITDYRLLDYRVTLFCLTLLFYCVIIMVNVALTVTITMDRNLREPMYIFICNLCINGLYGTSGFYPKFLLDLLSHHQSISYSGCLFQVVVIYSSVCIDICLLAVMAYDRSVAICRPLQYHSIMTKKHVIQLVSFSWLVPLGLMCTIIIFISRLKLCGSHIEKLYCAGWLMVKLSCSATSWITSTTPTNVVAYLIIIFYIFLGIFIVYTYVRLIKSCLKSLDSRGKFVKTCVPHLLALFNVIIAVVFDFMFMRFGSADLQQNLLNFFSMEMLIVPPLFNPLIYGLTLTQIRSRMLHPCLKKANCM
ncbi:olfactory receptor 1D2-like [Osmerus mordax]|uniref:olfactory receptor 1D2-like n=1 Tax=Osmerus mordax TaxID=8014 RepID=UPI00350F5A97